VKIRKGGPAYEYYVDSSGENRRGAEAAEVEVI